MLAPDGYRRRPLYGPLSCDEKKLGKHLAAVEGASNVDAARKFEHILRSGIRVDEGVYGRSAQVSLDATYLLRVIAYRGTVPRAAYGIEYDELDFDKRRDVIAAFRIVDIAQDGSITILWKVLSNQPAPYLKDDRKAIRDWVREFDVSVSKVGESAERTLATPQ